MTLIAVVIPTIDGREDLLRQTLVAYDQQREPGLDIRIVVVHNKPTIGEAWQAGREVVAEQVRDAAWVHLSADDVAPQRGALRSALHTSWAVGAYPSPRLLNVDGTLHSCGTLGAGMLLPEVDDLTPAGASPFPFIDAHQLTYIPPIPPIHYYADDWLAYQAQKVLGLRVVVDRGYTLTHLEGVVGRRRVQERAMADRAAMLAALSVQEPSARTPALLPTPTHMQGRRITR